MKIEFKEYHRYLPALLVDELEKLFSDCNYTATKDNFIKCISRIYRKSIESTDTQTHIPLAANYWRKIYGGEYRKNVLLPLLEADIIQQMDIREYVQRSSSKQAFLRYRINPNLLQGELVDAYESYTSTKRDRPQVKDVGIDKVKALKYIELNTTDWVNDNLVIHPDHIPDNFNITYHLQVGNSNQYLELHSTPKKIREKAILEGLTYFQYYSDYYLADIEEFKLKKVESIKFHFTQAVLSLHKYGYHRASTNDKTGRLYNELTNFPTVLFPMLKIKGESIIEIDVQSSQFLILSNLINAYITKDRGFLIKKFNNQNSILGIDILCDIMDEKLIKNKCKGVINELDNSQYDVLNDLDKFIHDVFYSDLYVVIQHHLNLKSRKVAKQLMFSLIFRKSTKTDHFIRLLNQLYPTMVEIINKFKKAINDAEIEDFNLSIFLSNIEGEIILGRVYKPLLKKNIPLIARHDSLSTTMEYMPQVQRKIVKAFAAVDFKLNTKITDMLFKEYTIDELEELNPDFVQWLLDDEETLDADYSLCSNNDIHADNLEVKDAETIDVVEIADADSNINEVNDADTEINDVDDADTIDEDEIAEADSNIKDEIVDVEPEVNEVDDADKTDEDKIAEDNSNTQDEIVNTDSSIFEVNEADSVSEENIVATDSSIFEVNDTETTAEVDEIMDENITAEDADSNINKETLSDSEASIFVDQMMQKIGDAQRETQAKMDKLLADPENDCCDIIDLVKEDLACTRDGKAKDSAIENKYLKTNAVVELNDEQRKEIDEIQHQNFDPLFHFFINDKAFDILAGLPFLNENAIGIVEDMMKQTKIDLTLSKNMLYLLDYLRSQEFKEAISHPQTMKN